MTDKTYIEEIEEQAALFTIGALPADEAKRFSQRLAADCPLCRSEVLECERVASALPLSAPEIAPSPRLRDRLFERIGVAKAPALKESGFLVRADEAPWQSSKFPGVDMRFLLKRKTMLVRMAPNTRIPAHPHSSGEQCLVLEGSVSSDGVTAFAGDFIYMPAGSTHDDLYSETGATFLIAYA